MVKVPEAVMVRVWTLELSQLTAIDVPVDPIALARDAACPKATKELTWVVLSLIEDKLLPITTEEAFVAFTNLPNPIAPDPVTFDSAPSKIPYAPVTTEACPMPIAASAFTFAVTIDRERSPPVLAPNPIARLLDPDWLQTVFPIIMLVVGLQILFPRVIAPAAREQEVNPNAIPQSAVAQEVFPITTEELPLPSELYPITTA